MSLKGSYQVIISALGILPPMMATPFLEVNLGFVNTQKPRTKNTTTKTMITSVTNPPPMYMISLPF